VRDEQILLHCARITVAWWQTGQQLQQPARTELITATWTPTVATLTNDHCTQMHSRTRPLSSAERQQQLQTNGHRTDVEYNQRYLARVLSARLYVRPTNRSMFVCLFSLSSETGALFISCVFDFRWPISTFSLLQSEMISARTICYLTLTVLPYLTSIVKQISRFLMYFYNKVQSIWASRMVTVSELVHVMCSKWQPFAWTLARSLTPQ